ncbi:uncharacterized protein ACNLHF_003977 isoform 2-T2 [Anomaloglossus baeobatrachus]|uniref:uncharacterized protein LOC142246040 isoform X2 n=1 Tax=Anomaloglossus baeobatrachus TaxID=238106 RepID=UPI003F4FFF6D
MKFLSCGIDSAKGDIQREWSPELYKPAGPWNDELYSNQECGKNRQQRITSGAYYNCRTRNAVYVLICSCPKLYVGETTQEIRRRVQQHFSSINTAGADLKKVLCARLDEIFKQMMRKEGCTNGKRGRHRSPSMRSPFYLLYTANWFQGNVMPRYHVILGTITKM